MHWWKEILGCWLEYSKVPWPQSMFPSSFWNRIACTLQTPGTFSPGAFFSHCFCCVALKWCQWCSYSLFSMRRRHRYTRNDSQSGSISCFLVLCAIIDLDSGIVFSVFDALNLTELICFVCFFDPRCLSSFVALTGFLHPKLHASSGATSAPSSSESKKRLSVTECIDKRNFWVVDSQTARYHDLRACL